MIRRKLGRKISAYLIIFAVPLLALAGVWIVAYEADSVEAAVVDRGRVAAESGAVAYGLILERGVDSGKIKMDDIAHPRYVTFEYEHPTDIPRYHSGIDAYTDGAGIRQLSDQILRTSPDFLYAVGSDIGTHIPTTNAKLDHEPTGDPKVDNLHSRQKRKYLDKLHLAAAASTELLIQSYKRDTGDLCWDISAPVWVHGVHWGSFRVGVQRDAITAHKMDLALRLCVIFTVLAVSLSMVILLMVRSSTQPLEALADAANACSVGEALDVPLRSSSPDEIGRLTRAFDRMRISYQHLAARNDRHTRVTASMAVVVDTGSGAV
jgi:hypothetical protein